MITIACDKCTKQESQEDSSVVVHQLIIVSRNNSIPSRFNIIIDLCEECKNKVIQYCKGKEEILDFPKSPIGKSQL